MTSSTSSSTEETTGFPENFRALLASLTGYLGARLELIGLEGKEAGAHWVKVIAFLLAAVGLLLFGYILLLLGGVALLAYLTGWHWGWFAFGLAVLHFVGVATCLLLAQARWKKPVFEITLREFQKDQQWLKQPNEKLS